ncbi:anti-sigma factor family protein [Microbacterium sp.]|uniref:anti-sigma factor family protein n=1 Tax=Microbacterium sp. TaxID=51671 RepID=UPI003A923CD8
MNTEHEKYADWDAAYALGALSATERAEFEGHLAECERCRVAVAELTSTVAALARVSAEDAQHIADQDADGAAPVRVLAAARARRRTRRRAASWIVGAAAAVVVATVISVALLMPRAPEAVALQPVGGAPVVATVALTSVPWGTRLDVVCAYEGHAGWNGMYELAVTAADGTTTTLSNWRVEAGATARLSAGTGLSEADIRSVEIRDASGDVVVKHEF